MDDRSDNNSAMMATNGLFYKMPQPLSVCVNRTFKKEYAQRQSYRPGETIVFDINSGSSYIDPSSCMLSFDLRVDAAANSGDVNNCYDFGTGAATNIIREIRLLSKNGCEIDRTQSSNVLSKILMDYTYGSDANKMLSMAGRGRYEFPLASRKFVIPMSLLSGFFRPSVKGMKIPAGIAAGLRIEFILETSARAITVIAGDMTGLTYSVESPELLFMSMDLNDPTQALLMRDSAETGLEYTFPSYFSTPHTTRSDRINEQVKKAVAQCTRSFCAVYDTVSVEDEKHDGFASINLTHHAFGGFQFRVGSNYYPKKEITDVYESLYVTSSCFNKTTEMQTFPSDINLTEYAVSGKFVIGVPIETDSRLNLSGVPLNNSNVLELRCSIAAHGSNLEYVLFIEYITVARVFINQTSIKN
jgi:hypothetical protein